MPRWSLVIFCPTPHMFADRKQNPPTMCFPKKRLDIIHIFPGIGLNGTEKESIPYCYIFVALVFCCPSLYPSGALYIPMVHYRSAPSWFVYCHSAQHHSKNICMQCMFLEKCENVCKQQSPLRIHEGMHVWMLQCSLNKTMQKIQHQNRHWNNATIIIWQSEPTYPNVHCCRLFQSSYLSMWTL